MSSNPPQHRYALEEAGSHDVFAAAGPHDGFAAAGQHDDFAVAGLHDGFAAAGPHDDFPVAGLHDVFEVAGSYQVAHRGCTTGVRPSCNLPKDCQQGSNWSIEGVCSLSPVIHMHW